MPGQPQQQWQQVVVLNGLRLTGKWTMVVVSGVLSWNTPTDSPSTSLAMVDEITGRMVPWTSVLYLIPDGLPS